MDWPNRTSEISLQCAEVKSVNIVERNNVREVTVNVLSYYDCSIFPVRVDCPLHMQYIPVVGQLVLIMRTANNFVRIIAHFGEQAFSAPIQEGEVMTEGSGGGFVYLNGTGDVTIGDGYLSNVQRFFSGVGINITADGYSLDVKDVGQINITPKDDKLGNENQIEILKIKDGNTKGRIVLTDEKTMVYSPAIEMGKDPDSSPLDLKGGVHVSSLPDGTPGKIIGPYNFDMMTGVPIPCSGTVKASS